MEPKPNRKLTQIIKNLILEQQVLPLLSKDDALQAVRDFFNTLVAVYVTQGQPKILSYGEGAYKHARAFVVLFLSLPVSDECSKRVRAFVVLFSPCVFSWRKERGIKRSFKGLLQHTGGRERYSGAAQDTQLR